jgi:dihydroxy-acid dehydratase
VCPEAADGGPIAMLRNGDTIEIDVPNRKLKVELNDEDLKNRLKSWEPKQMKVGKGYLVRYSQLVEPAHMGSVLRKA